MIKLVTYVFLCVLASLVVALPTLALADDLLNPSMPKMALKSTLPSLNDLSIPQPAAKEFQEAAATPEPFMPPPTAEQIAAAEKVMAAVTPAMQPAVIIQPQAAVAPGPQVQQTLPQDVPAFTVSYGDAETAVSQALTEKGAGQKISATINGRTGNPVFTYTKPLVLQIRGMNYDKLSGHWSANVLAMSGEEVVSAVPVSGHFDEMAEVPVLKHAIKSGEVISESDIAIHDFPLIHVHSDTVTDIANLVGKSPMRGISPLRPIRAEEIVEPTVIKKNALISMKYLSSGMEISTSGQALEDGAKGSIIAVRNTASKKVIRAVVEDAMTVDVAPTGAAVNSQALNTVPVSQGEPSHATN